MCLFGTATFASNNVATNISNTNLVRTTARISGEFAKVSPIETVIDERYASCTVTASIDVHVNGEYARALTSTSTVTLENGFGTCAFAQGIAQEAVNSDINDYANDNGVLRSYY